MKPIFEYYDYRLYLKEYYEEKRTCTRFFSVRYFSNKLGIDAGYFMKVMQGKLHLGEDYVPRVSSFLGLSREEAEYFRVLYLFNKAQREETIRDLFDQLMRLRHVQTVTMDENAEDFYKNTHCSVLRGLISLGSFSGNEKDLGEMCDPPIPSHQVKKALSTLEKLNLIIHEDTTGWKIKDKHIAAGSQIHPQILRDFQKQMMDLAKLSLDNTPKEERCISCLTLTAKQKDLPLIEERINEFRADLVRMVEESNEGDTVYQLNVQLFPLSLKRELST